MFFKKRLEQNLSEHIIRITPLSGGDINDAYKIETTDNVYALKVNNKSAFPGMFEKEKRGLEAISKSGARVPEVILTYIDAEYQYLLMEFIEEGFSNMDFWEKFAIGLARIHKTAGTQFGLDYDNYIGSLHQDNSQKSTWESFFIENRLIPLVKSAFNYGTLQKKHLQYFENFYKKVSEIVPQEKASLLHGDLWGGNLMKGKGSTPVFIDPAIYYGHREMDIAMTQMFGGFNNNYFGYYNEVFPMAPGWEGRIEIHNLYPNLVHLNLFGSGYLKSIENVINRF
ncbi:MAG: fructosamine kinase family protein [Bacteroidota bacterium]